MMRNLQKASEKSTPELNTIYNKESFALSYPGDNWNASRKLLARCIRKGKPGPILDIGCGLGFFLECCHKFGVPSVGLEGSAYAVQAAKEREPHLDIRQHDLEDPFPFEDETFSIVVCSQVIEHLPKKIAQNALRESHRVLSNGGNLFVYSPSITNPQSRQPAHINLHSPKSLKKELTGIGFKKVKHLNHPLKFSWKPLIPLNKVIRALFVLFPFSFYSASANCMATKLQEE
jgi:SAM-dependent methyltransferase